MNYMIQHYLKTAIRNLLKYKTHSIISCHLSFRWYDLFQHHPLFYQ